MYEPPPRDATPQPPRPAAQRNGSPAVWPPVRLWTEQESSDPSETGLGQVSDQFWRPAVGPDGGDLDDEAYDGHTDEARVLPLPNARVSAAPMEQVSPTLEGTRRAAALGNRALPAGPPPATAASLGMEDAPTSEFPRWGTGLVPPLAAAGDAPAEEVAEVLSEPTLHRLDDVRTPRSGMPPARRTLPSEPSSVPLPPGAPISPPGDRDAWTDPPAQEFGTPRRGLPQRTDRPVEPPADGSPHAEGARRNDPGAPPLARNVGLPVHRASGGAGNGAEDGDAATSRIWHSDASGAGRLPRRTDAGASLTDPPAEPGAHHKRPPGPGGEPGRTAERRGSAYGGRAEAEAGRVVPRRPSRPAPDGSPEDVGDSSLSDPKRAPVPTIAPPQVVPEGLNAGPVPRWLELMRMDAQAQAGPGSHAPGAPTEAAPATPVSSAVPAGQYEGAEPAGVERSRNRPGAGPELAAVPSRTSHVAPYQSEERAVPENPAVGWSTSQDGDADPATVLTAVRELPGVRAAELVGEPGRQQVLRLDLVASVDPHTVGRQAAALLKDQLGVHAAVRARSDTDGRYLPEPQRSEHGADPDDPPRRRRRSDGPERGAGRYGGDSSALAVSVEQVQVMTAGLEAAVEVGLAVSGVRVAGRASGPAHDWHVLRAAVTATTEALGMLLAGRARLALEYAELVPAGPARVAVVSLLLLSSTGTERVAGAAPVQGEAPDAAVLATIAAIQHRLAELLDGAALGH